MRRIILGCGCGHTATFEADSTMDNQMLEKWAEEWRRQHADCSQKMKAMDQSSEGTDGK